MKRIASIVSLILLATFASGCGNDYACKGLVATTKKFNEFDEAFVKKEKAKANKLYEELKRYADSWPTSGPKLTCDVDGNSKDYEFNQAFKDKFLMEVQDIKHDLDLMK